MATVVLRRPSAVRQRGTALAVTLRVVGRLVQGVVTLFLVSVLVFFATQAMPGDAARVVLGVTASPAKLAEVRSQLGLDDPLPTQYWNWLAGILHGDFGTSLASGRPIGEQLGGRIRNSVTLGAMSVMVIFPLALVVGVIAAQFKDRLFDRIFLAASMTVNALPEFVIGTLLIALFGTTVFQWLPPVSIIPDGHMPWWHPAELVLPVATLSVVGVMYLGRLIRASFIDVLASEYVQMARLKGLSRTKILFRHALPNALAPAIPAASLVAAFTVGGVVVVEYLFGYPGIGSLLIDAIGNRDIPVIQAVVMVIAATYFLFNFLADVLPAGKH